MISKHVIPIFPAVLYIGVSTDVLAERKKLRKELGAWHDDPAISGATALCTWFGSNFGVFFTPKHIAIRNISHEVFHLTHRILEHANANFDAEHHEQGAYLHGYLMDLVHRRVKRYLK